MWSAIEGLLQLEAINPLFRCSWYSILFIRYFFSRISHIFLVDVSYNTYTWCLVSDKTLCDHMFFGLSCPNLSQKSLLASSNCRVSSRFDTVRASITSHLHIPKFFLPSNFTKSILIGCGFPDFTVNRLSPAIPSTQCERTIQIGKIKSLPLIKTEDSLQIDLLHPNE